jgi:hypothetical protein
MALLLDFEEAQALTAPYHRLWIAAHREAEAAWWDRFRQSDPEGFIACVPTTRASYLHDRVVRHVANSVEATMVGRDRLGYAAQVIVDRNRSALVRFKMLDGAMNPRNHPSEQQDLLQQQTFTPEAMAELKMEGLNEAPTILTCGYQLALNEMSMSRIMVVLNYKQEAYYWYDLESGQSANVLGLPNIGELPASRVRSRRRKDQTGTEAE